MISKYKNISVIYGGTGRKYAEIFSKRISDISEKDRYPLSSTMIMESILTGELLTDVMNLFRKSEFCVAFLTADDVCVVDNKERYRLRQNVVFEIGMALIQLGRERCILLSDFDCRTDNMEFPTDMNSLEIRQFSPQDINSVMNDVLAKILEQSSVSLITGVVVETIPKYDNLLTRQEYYIDYENLFAPQLKERSYEGNKFFIETLKDWYEECAGLSHYDEQCIYLLERLGFLPLFGSIPEVNEFMIQSARLVENYRKSDILYYKDIDLLNFTRNLISNIIEYTQIKTNKQSNAGYLYKRLLDRFLSEDIPENITVNPLIMIVYYDYLGLTYLKLYTNFKETRYLISAQDSFAASLSHVCLVDMSMQIWSGFLYYNLARTYALQLNASQAEHYFKKAIRIRERWLKTSTYNTTIRNALSSEYFLAKIEYIDMCSNCNLLSPEEVRKELEYLEAELNTYSDFGDKIGPLVRIRKLLMERKQH